MKLAILPVSVALLLVAGLVSHAYAVAADKADTTPARTSKVQSPVQIDYQVIGMPIVGQPVAVELQLRSTLGEQPYRVSFRVNDPTAMQLPESQSATISIAPAVDAARSSQQVTVIPLREGRLYLNVAADIETDSGSLQTVIAIPIQVGAAAPRQILDNGTVSSDDEGNLYQSLPAQED